VERLLNPTQLAEVLGVRPGTVYSWLSRGVDIPHIKIQGTVRFREKAITDWLLQKERSKRKRNFEL
jgi:excisionase family DNA binding protein